MKVHILGDIHTRKEEPFFSSTKKLFTYLLDTIQKGDVLIQTGDLFHISRPYPSEYELVLDFLSALNRKGVTVVLLGGNHDYLYTRDSYSIDPFRNLATVITEPCTWETEGTPKFLMLPWMPEYRVKKLGYENLKNLYEESNHLDELVDGVDYIIHHIEDENIFMGGVQTGIDLSRFDIPRLGGHIHIQQKGYIGTPMQTRYDEKGQVGVMWVYDSETGESSYQELPVYHEYVDIEYGEYTLVENSILTIRNAPSRKAVYEKYGDYHYIRDIILTDMLTENENEVTLKESLEGIDIPSLFKEFAEENKIPKKVSSHILGIL